MEEPYAEWTRLAHRLQILGAMCCFVLRSGLRGCSYRLASVFFCWGEKLLWQGNCNRHEHGSAALSKEAITVAQGCLRADAVAYDALGVERSVTRVARSIGRSLGFGRLLWRAVSCRRTAFITMRSHHVEWHLPID